MAFHKVFRRDATLISLITVYAYSFSYIIPLRIRSYRRPLRLLNFDFEDPIQLSQFWEASNLERFTNQKWICFSYIYPPFLGKPSSVIYISGRWYPSFWNVRRLQYYISTSLHTYVVKLSFRDIFRVSGVKSASM